MSDTARTNNRAEDAYLAGAVSLPRVGRHMPSKHRDQLISLLALLGSETDTITQHEWTTLREVMEMVNEGRFSDAREWLKQMQSSILVHSKVGLLFAEAFIDYAQVAYACQPNNASPTVQ